jgi:DNA-binding NarL/FixJ family response regulator
MKSSAKPPALQGQPNSADIRIAIVDDDDRLRANLSQAVNRFAGCSCVSQFASGETALRDIPLDPPDVVFMDINMTGMSGIECVWQLKASHPAIEFIMLTVYQDSESVFNSLAAGASGYLLKRATREQLLAAIQQVHAGGSPMTSQIARKVVQAFRQQMPSGNKTETAKLSPREQQVLELLAKGFLYKEIADSLTIEYATVHGYIRRIYEKLRVRSRGQAVAKYYSEARSLPGGGAGVRRVASHAPGRGPGAIDGEVSSSAKG